MRLMPALGALALLLAAASAAAQEGAPAGAEDAEDAAPAEAEVPPAPAEEAPSEDRGGAEPAPVPAAPSATEEHAPKVAVVVVGDPDDRLRALARQVDAALEPTLRRPFDPGLRGALRGEPGEPDDGLSEVRRDRRRLSGEEAADAPALSRLGRRAGALVVAVLRARDEGVELVVLDVRHGAFYRGALPLDASTEPARIVRFLERRARAATHVEGITPADAAAASAAADPPAAPAQERSEPDFFEQYWPFLVAGLLLAGMITAILVSQATQGEQVPVLRFVPGGG
ncbi:MAG: hypothetical protein KF729_23575 [Sandaracinaceae bacterium]|nr:hypothetical protein [Sandaracinaceae bacterium]